VPLPAPLTTPLMRASAAGATGTDGAAAVLGQPNSGVPYKLYARAAGHAHVDVTGFLGASLVGRGGRIALVGGCLGLLGAATSRWRRWYPQYLAILSTVFAVGLAVVVRSWSE
jgi:1-acyl-sn-glycerol-3-phosphate acyltransferase